MNPRSKRIVLSAACLGAVGAAAVALRIWFDDSPGGMRPTYPAVDGDARLAREARTALPIIAAIDRYGRDHGAFPAHAADLRPYLPDARITEQADQIDRWRYFRTRASSGYTLSLRLGWDPDLEYHREPGRRYWVFNPGDGSAERAVELRP